MGHQQIIMFIVPRKAVIQSYNWIEKDTFTKQTSDYSIIRKELERLWEMSDFHVMELVHSVDRLFAKKDTYHSEYHYGWKSRNYPIDNDAGITINPDSSKINEMIIRPDFWKDDELDFFKKTIDFLQKYELLIVDMRGNLFEPNLQGCISLFEHKLRTNEYTDKIVNLFNHTNI
jgi:hypothetical protein